MKKCFKCGLTKEINDFYEHPQMADGHLNKCKECTKKDVNERYITRPRKELQEYERRRNKTPERKKQRAERLKKDRNNNHEKFLARDAVAKALVSGKLTRQPCEFEGEDCEGRIGTHHEDYSKPLDVRWLCLKHHRIIEGRWRERPTQP